MEPAYRIGQRETTLLMNLFQNRGWSDTNSRSRCGSRLSDYADGMAHGRVERDGWRIAGVIKNWNKRHSNTIADISIPTGYFYNWRLNYAAPALRYNARPSMRLAKIWHKVGVVNVNGVTGVPKGPHKNHNKPLLYCARHFPTFHSF